MAALKTDELWDLIVENDRDIAAIAASQMNRFMDGGAG